MSRFIITGGKRLSGRVAVSGMKNAATPILAATLLASGPCTITNVPRLTDVERMLELLRGLGARADWSGENAVTVDPRPVVIEPLQTLVRTPEFKDHPLGRGIKAMRSSVLLIGPLLARFRSFAFPEPGGCIIGNRPLDTHVAALSGLGAVIRREGGLYLFDREKLQGSQIILPEFSVTATENLVMAATAAEGVTEIHLAAAEPHVQDLVCFLRALGAKIRGDGTHTIVVEGGHPLAATDYQIIPDQIEVGTFAIAAAVTHGDVAIEGCEPSHLEIVLLKLRIAGVPARWDGKTLLISPPSQLDAFRLQALPYPGIPTDLQAPFAVLATQCNGTSLIHDPLYEGRMGYIAELVKMGANAVVCDPHRVLISGPTPLYGNEIRSLDLRAGATLVVAALVAQGTSVIHDAEILDRGYEHLAERLNSLGADIKREQ
jgi:UDP-N-acetylglucosamine 1-carboxyvinyltransferase